MGLVLRVCVPQLLRPLVQQPAPGEDGRGNAPGGGQSMEAGVPVARVTSSVPHFHVISITECFHTSCCCVVTVVGFGVCSLAGDDGMRECARVHSRAGPARHGGRGSRRRVEDKYIMAI